MSNLPPSPSLRAARPEDSPRVADILIETRRQFMPYAPSAHTEPEIRAWVATRLVPSGGVVVAEVAGEVVGVMATSAEPGVSWINQLYVHRGWVGRGLGSVLLAQACATLPLPIRLYTFQPNTGARRFYERHGFVAIEWTDGHGNEERCPDVLYELRARHEPPPHP